MAVRISIPAASQEQHAARASTSRGRPRSFDIDSALDTAMKLFWEKGYNQTTMVDICNAIGIKPPSFYHAFGSKDELFLKTLDYYDKIYWNPVADKFFADTDIYEAVKHLFEAAVRIYLRPNLPKGCFMDVSTVGLAHGEKRIREALADIQERGRNNIRRRLLMAIEDGQLPQDCDVPAITGALYTFLKGISAVAREHICQAELDDLSRLGISLLPSKQFK